MPQLSITILETDAHKLEAQLDVYPIAATGDGRHEPREPARAETVLDALLLTERTRRAGQTLYTCREVECPAWLRDLILDHARDEADETAADYLADAAAEIADQRYDEARS